MPLSPTQRSTIVALGVAITSILLHSTADFGLRIPGVAFAFLCVLVTFVRATADPQLVDPAFDPDAWREQRRRRRSSRER